MLIPRVLNHDGGFAMAPKKKLLTLNITKLKALSDDEGKTVQGGSGTNSTTCGTTYCPKSG